MHAHAGVWDCPPEDVAFVAGFLADTEYNDYDRLIQLCDALALPTGFCLIEKRLVDISLRHGVNEYTIPRWQATFDLQQYFEQIIGGSIYELLPGIVENTFSTPMSSDLHTLSTGPVTQNGQADLALPSFFEAASPA